jgi:PD-(D/E)XK nuclease superfamily
MQAGKELVPVCYGDGGTKAMALEHAEITEQIIGAAFEVYSILGYGFLERVYQRAMQVELLNNSRSRPPRRMIPGATLSVFNPCFIRG